MFSSGEDLTSSFVIKASLVNLFPFCPSFQEAHRQNWSCLTAFMLILTNSAYIFFHSCFWVSIVLALVLWLWFMWPELLFEKRWGTKGKYVVKLLFTPWPFQIWGLHAPSLCPTSSPCEQSGTYSLGEGSAFTWCDLRV